MSETTARRAPRKSAGATVAEKGTPAPAGAPSPYPPGTKLFKYEASTGDTIVFPSITAVRPPTTEFWWELYNSPDQFQAFVWMDHAQVPKNIQRKVVQLPAAEMREFLDQWFAEAKLSAEK